MKALPNLAYRTLVATFSIVLLSELVAVNAKTENAKKSPPSATIAQSNNSAAYKQGQQFILEGKQLWQQGTPSSQQQAIAKYEEALKIWRQIKERSPEIKTLNSIAIFYYLQGNEQKAANYFTIVDAINPGVSKKGQQLLGEGKQLTQQGTLESRQQALVKYQKALKIWQQTNNSVFEAFTLSPKHQFKRRSPLLKLSALKSPVPICVLPSLLQIRYKITTNSTSIC